VAIWVAALAGAIEIPSALDPVAWHAHEMMFGFALAAVGGFLLTAIPNWTERDPVAGRALALLAMGGTPYQPVEIDFVGRTGQFVAHSPPPDVCGGIYHAKVFS